MRLVLIVFLTLIGIAGSAEGAEAVLSVSSEMVPSTLLPGNEGFIKITVSNNGTTDAPHVYIKAESIDPPLFFTDPKASTARYLGDLDAKGSVSTSYKFAVPKETPSGLYSAKVVAYQYTGDQIKKTVVRYVIIPVQALAALSIKSVTPSSFRPGESTVMEIVIQNTGDSKLNNLLLSWKVGDDVLLPQGADNIIAISSLEPGKEHRVTIPVAVGTGAVPNVYPLVVSGSYLDQTGTMVSVNSTVGVTIGGTTDFGVSMQQVSGGTLTLSVANIGINKASAISVKIPKQEAFSLEGASEAFLGNLNPGDYTVASFRLQPTGKGSLIVEVHYTDTAGNRGVVRKDVEVDAPAAGQRQGAGSGFAGGQTGGSKTGINYIVIGATGIAVTLAIWRLRIRGKK